MLRISKEFVTDNCSPKNPPVARCQSGDTVMFETRDCYDDRLQGDGKVYTPLICLPSGMPLFPEKSRTYRKPKQIFFERKRLALKQIKLQWISSLLHSTSWTTMIF